MTLQTFPIADGIRLHTLSTTKFKTVTWKVFVQTPLGERTTETALLPMVLSRGSKTLPTTQAIASHLADLYGAHFDSDIAKIGERQCVEFYFEMVDSSYLPDGEGLMERGIATFCELIRQPRVENGGFYPPYVEQERVNLKNRINSLINDKRSYALQKFYEVMFSDEPFSKYKYGSVAAVEQINPQGLFQYYQELVQENPIEIFVVGNIDPAAIRESIAGAFAGGRKCCREMPEVEKRSAPPKPREVKEPGDVQQGIVFQGYRIPVTYKDPDYYKLLVYNGVLGGFPHSKLFVNVREKESLAYYTWSRIDATKGFIMTNAGIDPAHYQRTVDIMQEQVEEINRGNVSDEELEATKKGLISNLLTMEDNSLSVIDRAMVGVVNGVVRDREEVIRAIGAVSKDDLVEQGQRLQLDTIYFLHGRDFSG